MKFVNFTKKFAPRAFIFFKGKNAMYQKAAPCLVAKLSPLKTQHVRTSAIYSFIGFWTWSAPEELDKQAQCSLRSSALQGARRVFLNPILPSYWFKNAPEYKLFLQTSVVTFVKCLLLSPLKVKTMKYYLICNPRKCPETTCLPLESCQNKVRGKVEPENHNLRLRHAAQITGGACGLRSGFQPPQEHLHFIS